MLVAEIFAVGTEILLGDIVNSNAQFLSRQLAQLGIPVYGHTAVGDNHKRLLTALEYAYTKADVVISSGGLGPTLDDITKEVAAEYFGTTLEIHEPSMKAIRQRFESLDRELPQNAERNALIPVGSTPLPNHFGSAPGVLMEKDGKILILLPGPPHEMEPMFIKYAVPFLRQKTDKIFVSRTLKIVSIGETAVEEALRDLIDAQGNPTIAPYAKLGEVHLRLTASAETEAAANALIEPVAKEIHCRLGANIYGEDEDELEDAVVKLLQSKSCKLALAESCTGGHLTSLLVSVPGVSEVLNEAVVAYSNDAKTARLNVGRDQWGDEILAKYGAVSAETARAMAKGAAEFSDADYGLSTTGIAGPDGGTPDKPVGLVWIGLHKKGGETVSYPLKFKGSRNTIRNLAAKNALDVLRRELIFN